MNFWPLDCGTVNMRRLGRPVYGVCLSSPSKLIQEVVKIVNVYEVPSTKSDRCGPALSVGDHINIKKRVTFLTKQNNCQGPVLSSGGSSPHGSPVSPRGRGGRQGSTVQSNGEEHSRGSWEAPGGI